MWDRHALAIPKIYISPTFFPSQNRPSDGNYQVEARTTFVFMPSWGSDRVAAITAKFLPFNFR